jgi:hypothetical protein
MTSGRLPKASTEIRVDTQSDAVFLAIVLHHRRRNDPV